MHGGALTSLLSSRRFSLQRHALFDSFGIPGTLRHSATSIILDRLHIALSFLHSENITLLQLKLKNGALVVRGAGTHNLKIARLEIHHYKTEVTVFAECVLLDMWHRLIIHDLY